MATRGRVRCTGAKRRRAKNLGLPERPPSTGGDPVFDLGGQQRACKRVLKGDGASIVRGRCSKGLTEKKAQ